MYDEDGRCGDCDGHWRHFEGCALYTGEPYATLEQRWQIAAMVDALGV